jgi:hypothetical protein
VNSSDADIVKMLHFVSHHLSGNDSFFCDRDIASSSRNYGNHSLAIFRRIFLKDDRTPEFSIFHATNFLLRGRKLFFVGTSCQNVAAVFRQPRKNSSDLCRSLALTQYHLWHPSSQRAVVIDFCEAEIFKRHVPQACDCVVGREFALAYFMKQFANGVGVQEVLKAG